ncbi:MAG TPA: molybdenum cofactor biosynthesis protein MoaE [Candidatus Acidoferrales bacterium]|nr:molybdenum cofactor biosynthesis protein MoaE [Candidatus Acidoferrales bacterium]
MITALLFARLREQAGTGLEQIEPGAATVGAVYARLRQRHPQLESDLDLIRPALNQAFAGWEDAVVDGDEVAFIPPVSGGADFGPLFELTSDELDPRRLERAVIHPGAGAICTFSGVVRDISRGVSVTHLEYEGYAGMVESQMALIAEEIASRWPQARVAMAHRTGQLGIGEVSVVVATSAPHRAQAIAACQWGIDRLKESVPVWKKEFSTSGATWIEGDDTLTPPA